MKKMFRRALCAPDRPVLPPTFAPARTLVGPRRIILSASLAGGYAAAYSGVILGRAYTLAYRPHLPVASRWLLAPRKISPLYKRSPKATGSTPAEVYSVVRSILKGVFDD